MSIKTYNIFNYLMRLYETKLFKLATHQPYCFCL